MLKRKSPEKNWVVGGRTTEVRSLFMLSFLMLYSSRNDVSLHDSKKSVCLFGLFISKSKRESLKNVTLPVRLQQLGGLHEKITKPRVNVSLCPAVPNSFPLASHQYLWCVTTLQISHLLPVVRWLLQRIWKPAQKMRSSLSPRSAFHPNLVWSPWQRWARL